MPILIAIAVLLTACLAYRLRSRRLRASSDDEADEIRKRQIARERVRRQAPRLHELEERLLAFAEGSDPGVPGGAEALRIEAAALRERLEADCRKHRLPLGIVRYHGARRMTLTPGIVRRLEE